MQIFQKVVTFLEINHTFSESLECEDVFGISFAPQKFKMFGLIFSGYSGSLTENESTNDHLVVDEVVKYMELFSSRMSTGN